MERVLYDGKDLVSVAVISKNTVLIMRGSEITEIPLDNKVRLICVWHENELVAMDPEIGRCRKAILKPSGVNNEYELHLYF